MDRLPSGSIVVAAVYSMVHISNRVPGPIDWLEVYDRTSCLALANGYAYRRTCRNRHNEIPVVCIEIIKDSKLLIKD